MVSVKFFDVLIKIELLIQVNSHLFRVNVLRLKRSKSKPTAAVPFDNVKMEITKRTIFLI